MSIQSNFPNTKPSLLLDFANTKQLDNRVTFTRSTPAVYYDGRTTAMAEQNIFQQSQTFDNAYWLKYTGTITANSTTAPDGTSTADTFTEASGSVLPCFYVNAGSKQVNETFTLSVYAKANGRNYIWLKQRSGTNAYIAAIYDLSAPSVSKTQAGSSGFIASTSITSVGSGWYRLTLTGYVSGTSNAETLFGLSDTGTPTIDAEGNIATYTGNGTSGAYFWGAQFEARSSATAYTATTTQPITNYIPVLLSAGGNQPRFDCNPTTGESLGLLIEEQRTNLLAYSENFTGYNQFNCSISANVAIAPNGTQTADKLVESTTTGNHQIEFAFSATSGAVYSLSMYVKAAGRTQFRIFAFGDNGVFDNTAVVFDLSAGTIISGTGGTIQFVGNGWYRCTSTKTSGATAVGYWGMGSLVGGVSNYTGDGFSGLMYWGAQLEVGAFPSSYIATSGASATRTADAASMTGANFSSWYNADEGSWYSEAATSSTTGNGRIFSVSSLAGASDPIYSINFESNGQTRIYQVVSGSATYDFRPSNYSANTFVKLSGGYKLADYAGVANNSTISTSTSQVRLPMLTYLQIGALTNGSSFFLNGTIKKIAYYPIKVTNAQLQALTS